jgi:serine/threonine protein kinase
VVPERVDTLVGSMLGKDYRVIQPIGTGGMAVVYLVEHQTLLKRFAAKVLSMELASSTEARARFTQEAHAASQLDHENIVSISDFGVTADHRPFFVMELLRGQTLDQRLGDGPMAIEEVVAVAVPVARALAHAHAEGIVHRDVKPENIFLVQRSQGRWGVKVVDFGIAKTPVNPKLTSMGETLGSPLFMAPEMIRGEDDVDQRADVYSFGVLLYLMLCNRLPYFDENLLKVMQMHLSAPVPPPQSVNPALSPELAAVLDRALAKRPDDRYPSMDALLIDLEAALPSGADRLLIEAQSGSAAHDTPFAAALAIARNDSQRTLKVSEPSLRTMRVAPLPSPIELPPVDPPRATAQRRIGIVVASALISGLTGVVVYWQIAGRGSHRTPAVAAAPQEPSAPPDQAAPAAPRTAPIVTPLDPPVAPTAAPPRPVEATAAAPAPDSPPATARAVPEADRLNPKRPIGRPKPPVRHEPPRPPRRVASATAPTGTGARGVPSSTDAEPPAAPTANPSAAPSAVAAPAAAAAVAAPAPAAPILPRPAPPVGPGSLDALPQIASLEVAGSLSPSVVRRSLDRALSSLRTCYQAAARAGNATPPIDLQLRFEIDENSLATHVATGGTSFGSLGGCAAGVIGGVHTQQAPDTGTAQVSVLIRFRPSEPP